MSSSPSLLDDSLVTSLSFEQSLPPTSGPRCSRRACLFQLATETGWRWETISHWITLGLLEAEEIELRGQPCRVISPAQLLAFRQTYVPLADLARAMGTKSSVLSESLAKVELVGFQVSPGGVRRGGLVRLADLGRLAVLSTKTAAQAASTSELMIQY